MGNEKVSPYSVLPLLENTIKYSTLLIGFLYLCGFIIRNAYLGSLGISQISAFNIEYVLSGISYVIFISAPFFIVYVPYYFIKRTRKKLDAIFIGFSVLFYSGGAVILVLVTLLNGRPFIRGPFSKIIINTLYKVYFPLFWIVSFSTIYCIYLFIDAYKYIYKEKKKTIYGIWGAAIVLIYMFLSSLFLFTAVLYPKVHSAFAGGKPISANILLSEHGVSIAKSFGFEIDNTRLIQRVSLVHETSSMLYFLAPKSNQMKSKSIALPKNIIQGVSFLSDDMEQK
jgi:hypothetical protein